MFRNFFNIQYITVCHIISLQYYIFSLYHPKHVWYQDFLGIFLFAQTWTKGIQNELFRLQVEAPQKLHAFLTLSVTHI